MKITLNQSFVSINKILLEHCHTYLCIVYGCSCTISKNNCNKHEVSCKAKNIYYPSLQDKSANTYTTDVITN